MTNVMPIMKKELRSYFASPVAYIVLTVFLLICGWFFSTSLFVVGQALYLSRYMKDGKQAEAGARDS